MKKLTISKSLSLLLLITLPLIFISCKEDPDAIVSVKNDPNVAIISKSARYIDSTMFNANIISISPDNSIITFKATEETIANLTAGQILVTEKGMGLLRKIISVQRNDDEITLITEQASLTDLFEKASINYTKKITSSDIEAEIFSKPGVVESKSDSKYEFAYNFINVIIFDLDNNPNTKYDQIVLNGSIEIDITFGLRVEIENWRLKDMRIAFTTEEVLKIECKTTLVNMRYEKEVLIKTFRLKPIVFFVGWVPVVITPNLDIYLGSNGELKAKITSYIEQNAGFTAGLKYNNGSWQPFKEISHNFIFQPPTFSAEAKLTGYVKPQFELMLYGTTGPYANIKLAGEFEVSIIPNPGAQLYACIYVGVGAKFKVLDKKITDYSVEDLVTVRIKIWEQSELKGKITGSIKDAVSNAPLSNVKIVAYRGNEAIDSTISNTSGTYELFLPVYNGYKVVFSKPGYLPATYENINVQILVTTILEAVLQINQSYSGYGTIKGVIRNALTGHGVSGLNLKLRKGINVTTGTPIKTTTTVSNGEYSFTDIEAGNYTIEASGTGYNTTYFSAICLGNQTISNQDATISPILSPGETRIILTWGSTPRDLDSHLTGPLPDGNRFHMYYIYKGNNSPWPNIVNLDLDDIDGHGPETTTLYQQIDGVYRFSVHDYTNRNSTNSYALSNSNALVRVYQSNGLVASFNVPPNQEGTLWTVFEMTGSTITPINNMTYESDPSRIRKTGYINPDIDLFKDLPPKK